MAAVPVQSAVALYGSSASKTVVLGSVGPGNLIWVGVCCTQLTTINTPTDDKSDTYTAIHAQINHSGGVASLRTWYAKNVTGGTTTITVTLAASEFGFIIAHEVSGLDTSAPLDVEAAQEQSGVGTGADLITSGAVTTTANGDYVVGLTVNNGFGSVNEAVGTNYTSGQNPDDNGFKGRSEYLVQAASGSIAGTFTAGSAAQDWITSVAAFKAGGGGGGATVTYPELERGTNRGSNRGRNTGIARSFVRRDRVFVPAYAVVGDLKVAA